MATSIEVSNIARLRMWSESTFASDGTGTLGNYDDVPFIEGTLTAVLGQEMPHPAHAQQHVDGWSTRIAGLKSCKLSFAMNLAPTGTASGDAVAHSQSALGRLFKAVFGGQTLSTGDTVSANAGASKTVFTAAGTGVVAGDVVGILRGASAAYEMREVESEAADVVTTKLEFSNAPVVSDILYSSATHYLTQNPTESLQFIAEGLATGDRWVLLGMQLESLALENTIGQIPRATFGFQGVSWLTGQDAAYTSTSALAAASYTNVSVIHAVGELLLQTLGTSTRPTPTKASSIAITLNLGYGKVTSPSGTQAVASWRRLRTAPVATAVITMPYAESETSNESDWLLARDAITRKMMSLQFGNVQGKSILITLPTCVITDYQLGDAGGIRSEIVTLEAQTDGDVGSSTTDQALSAFRIAQG